MFFLHQSVNPAPDTCAWQYLTLVKSSLAYKWAISCVFFLKHYRIHNPSTTATGRLLELQSCNHCFPECFNAGFVIFFFYKTDSCQSQLLCLLHKKPFKGSPPDECLPHDSTVSALSTRLYLKFPHVSIDLPIVSNIQKPQENRNWVSHLYHWVPSD